jgi:DNA-binding HxlR family transcriptional regulator
MTDPFSQNNTVHVQRADQVWEALQGKWTLHILREMLDGPVRLSQLRREFPGASKKALTASLKRLQKYRIIRRKDLSRHLLHVEYELSEPARKVTSSLINALDGFAELADLRFDENLTTLNPK